jgi:valyl-tRNA synthetase
MLASYPEGVDANKNNDAEASMEETMKIIKACRSLRASYNIPNKTLTKFFVKVSGPGEAAAKAQLDDIKNLGKASEVVLNPPEADTPTTVGTVIVDDQLTVLMDVKGLIDFDVEIKRLQKSLKSNSPLIATLSNKIAADGYAENVPDDLQKSNSEKLESLQKTKTELEEAIANLEKLQALEKS